MRVLVVTNMYPTAERPALGSFVRDQVRALRRLPDVEIEVFTFSPGSPEGYVRAAADLRRRRGFDIVHAHFGLTAWPALAARARARAVTLHGTDLVHPRSRALTTAALPFYDLVATVSEPLGELVPGWAVRRQRAVLPVGVDIERFAPISRGEARERLGLPTDQPCVLFPGDPRRPEKRFDRAREVVGEEVPLHTLGAVDPDTVPLWVNAASAVLVPSEREGFGLAVLEALACNVPVLATPVGIHPEALDGLPDVLCAEFHPAVWGAALAPHLAAADPRVVGGRERAVGYSTDVMARRVLDAWRAVLETQGR